MLIHNMAETSTAENPTIEEPCEPKQALCKLCSEYYRLPDCNFCSQCKIDDSYSGRHLSLSEIIDLPDCNFKGKQLNERIVTLCDVFIQKRFKHGSVIKSDAASMVFVNMCKNKTPLEVSKIFSGRDTDGHVRFIFAKYANMILSNYVDSPNTDKEVTWILVHAVCPYVVDIWNINSVHQAMCYYMTFKTATPKCPSNINELFSLWNRQGFYNFE